MKGDKLRIIDADGHVVETDSVILEYLPAPFKGSTELLGMPFFPSLDGWHRAARRVADGKGRRLEVPTAEDWLEYLDEAEIELTVLYPTAGLGFGLIRDPDWAVPLAQGYNNWLYDRFLSASPARLKGMALIPIQDPAEAAKELRRATTELGMAGAVLPGVGQRLPLGHRHFWPVYEAAQELDTMLTVHSAPSLGLGLDLFDRFIEVRTLTHPFGQMLQLTGLVFEGVFDAFPRLRMAVAEAGAGWIPYLMERLDMEYENRSSQAGELTMAPSEYLRSGRLYFHTEVGERGLAWAIAELGEEVFFVASDYPHEPRHEFPEAVQQFMMREDISDSAKRKILYDNPKRMYRL